MYVRPHGTTRLQLDGFYLHLIPEHFFFSRKSVQKIQVPFNCHRNTGTLHQDRCAFMLIPRWILPRMRIVSDKSCTESQNTHFMFNNCFPNIMSFMRMWKKKCGTAGQATNGNIILRMHFVCWITKATDSHSEYVILSVFYGKDGYANAPQCYFSKNTACGHLLAALPSQGKKCHAIKKKYYNINRHYQGNEGLSRNSLLPRGGRSISA